MLPDLPDECKQKIWQFFEVVELCRVSNVCQDISNGANAGVFWKQKTMEMIEKEKKRLKKTNVPLACAFQRQNATRELMRKADFEEETFDFGSTKKNGCMDIRESPYLKKLSDFEATFWFHSYRDLYVVSPLSG
jgi:hypothetical protein